MESVYKLLSEIKNGQVIRPKLYKSNTHCVITKNPLVYDNGQEVVSALEEEWVEVAVGKTTVTTESGQKVVLTREDAKKLNLL